MRNKKNIYFLLPAVIIVWGLLVYNIFNGLSPSSPQTQTIESLRQFKPETIAKADTFTIKVDYRDPFLGTFEKKRRKVTKRNNTPIVKKVSIPFPSIVYKGIVSPKGTNEKVFLISVNGQQHLFKRKMLFNEVKLLNGNAQEITVQFQQQKQTFQLVKNLK